MEKYYLSGSFPILKKKTDEADENSSGNQKKAQSCAKEFLQKWAIVF